MLPHLTDFFARFVVKRSAAHVATVRR